MSSSSLWPRIALVLLASFGLSASSAFAQHDQSSAQREPETSPTLDAARRRWERLTPAEQQRARERYERYQQLSESERHELALRTRRLDETRERIVRGLAPETRERLAALSPDKRREMLDELVAAEARELGRLVRSELPEDWVGRLERARPEDRARFLAQWKEDQGGTIQRRALGELGTRLELPADEIARLQSLPVDQAREALLELRKRIRVRDAEQRGLPRWLEREQWEQWKTLPPRDFFEAWKNAQREHEPSTPETSEPAPAPGAIEARPASTQAKRRWLRELSAAMRLAPEELLEHAELPAAERARRLAQLRRERALRVITRSGLFERERIAELEHLPPQRFFEEVRRYFGPVETRRSEDPRREDAPERRSAEPAPIDPGAGQRR